MKNIYKFLVAGLILLVSCSEDDLERVYYPHSQPIIEEASLTSLSGENQVIAGDSVLFTAKVSDPVTPLSTLEVTFVIQDRLVLKEKIRTTDLQSEISAKFQIPFYANLEDGTVPEVFLTLENVEGDKTEATLSEENNIQINKPSFGNRLYFVMQNGTVYTANRVLGSQSEYQTPKLNLAETSIRFKIAEKITSDNEIDYSGFVWGDANDQLAIIEEDGNFYQYTDPLIITINQFKFDVYSFDFTVDAERYNPIIVSGVELEAETLDGNSYMSANIGFSTDQEVEFSGIDNLSDALNPDFFEYISDTKAKFLGLSGSYKILYNTNTGFIYVEQSDAVYPNALWICGTGIGFAQPPYSTTTSWNWSKPEDYRFCRKISDGVFQVTFYADDFDMKFFHQRMWGNDDGSEEENSSGYTITPTTLMKAGANDAGEPNGNFVAGDAFTAGVYRVVINVNDKTIGIESVE
ncbi:MAG: DUF5016 domain-containing protein [Candidatus Azobacteroides sp.]|nr:DUF5016 domain-containing protein [Candidatus Azobacteroides sp.]